MNEVFYIGFYEMQKQYTYNEAWEWVTTSPFLLTEKTFTDKKEANNYCDKKTKESYHKSDDGYDSYRNYCFTNAEFLTEEDLERGYTY